LCLCNCGEQQWIDGHSLRRGATTSCGCFRLSQRSLGQRPVGSAPRKSGHIALRDVSLSAEYFEQILRSEDLLSDVTTNPKARGACYYVNRGVAVCDRWRTFTHFLADMGERPANTSLDRINNNRGYESGNCRWATSAEQGRNQRNTKLLLEGAVRVALRSLAGESHRSIANSIGVSPATVSTIMSGKSWKGAVEEAHRRRQAQQLNGPRSTSSRSTSAS
jgi:hypothetical protein